MTYKVKSENFDDIGLFYTNNKDIFIALKKTNVKLDENYKRVYIELTFESNLQLCEIISLMKKIENSHVMYQTVQPIEKYTGERNYNL